jgi:anti-sigma factor RsiW
METCPREKELLLEQSGELSARRARRLEGHLAGCATCRAHRAMLRTLLAETGRTFAACEPSAAAAAAVRRMAAAGIRPRRPVYLRPSVQVLAYAALLTLFLGGWVFNAASHRERRRAKLDAALAIVAVAAEDVNDGKNPTLHDLARQLIDMEGLTDDSDALELLNAIGAPPPTAFQARNTRGLT